MAQNQWGVYNQDGPPDGLPISFGMGGYRSFGLDAAFRAIEQNFFIPAVGNQGENGYAARGSIQALWQGGNDANELGKLHNTITALITKDKTNMGIRYKNTVDRYQHNLSVYATPGNYTRPEWSAYEDALNA